MLKLLNIVSAHTDQECNTAEHYPEEYGKQQAYENTPALKYNVSMGIWVQKSKTKITDRTHFS